MKKKALALIPFVARRVIRKKRQSQARRGARIGAPALVALGGAAAGFLMRRRRRTAAGHDVSPQELGHTDAARAEAARTDPAGDTGTAPAGSGAVTPDLSADDPLVREQTDLAAAEAGGIGGDVPDTPPSNEPDFATDPATRPVEEHSGNSYESFAERQS